MNTLTRLAKFAAMMSRGVLGALSLCIRCRLCKNRNEGTFRQPRAFHGIVVPHNLGLRVFFLSFAIILASSSAPFNRNIKVSAAPLDNCAGFENPPQPTLLSEPFVFHQISEPIFFMPGTIADWDNDGNIDLQFAQNQGNWTFKLQNTIFNLMENQGYAPLVRKSVERDRLSLGQFKDIRQVETFLKFHGVASFDIENDGLQDFILSPQNVTGVPIMLFHNLGNWNFELVQQSFFENLLGFNSSSTLWSEAIVVGDFTGDGLNDIYIAMNTYLPPYQAIFLRNTGSGFIEEAALRGIDAPESDPNKRSEGAQGVDFNSDGYLDLYVGHYFYINDGTGQFTDMRAGYGLPSLFDEGIEFVDYDNDGQLDLFIRDPNITMQLWRNTGSGFVNASVSSGLACLTQGTQFFWGDNWVDFDGDGDQDLMYFSFNGGDYKYYVVMNQGDGTFKLGYSRQFILHLTSIGDFDGDGDLDMYSGGIIGGGYGTLSENVFPKHSPSFPLAVVPLDDQGKMSEQGATVQVQSTCSSLLQTQIIRGNRSYLSQGDYPAHFAIPETCPQQISVAFLKKGHPDRTVVTIPYDPLTDGAARYFVTRNGSTKAPYSIRRYYFPAIGK